MADAVRSLLFIRRKPLTKHFVQSAWMRNWTSAGVSKAFSGMASQTLKTACPPDHWHRRLDVGHVALSSAHSYEHGERSARGNSLRVPLRSVASISDIKVHPRRIAEVVLNAVVEGVVKVGEQVIDLGRPEGCMVADRDIYTPAKRERESISAGSFRESTAPSYWLANGLKGVAVYVGMRSPKQKVNEQLNFRDADL